jgi:hypothetical protein
MRIAHSIFALRFLLCNKKKHVIIAACHGRCSICAHPRVEEIDASLFRIGTLHGETVRGFVGRYQSPKETQSIRSYHRTPWSNEYSNSSRGATGGKDSPALRELRTCVEQMGKRQERDLDYEIASKVSEVTCDFDPGEIARLKMLAESGGLVVQ